MKKITGKVVSLVLALALVVTSFSANFAFAATKSVTGTVSDTAEDSIYLVNGGTTSTARTYSDIANNFIVPVLDTKDHVDGGVSGVEVSAISHVSGDRLVKWSIDSDGIADLTLKSSDSAGKEVLSILYEGTYSDADGNDVTVKASKQFTVNALDAGSAYVGVYSTTVKDGEAPDDVGSFARNVSSVKNIAVYEATVKGATDPSATWTVLKTPVIGTSSSANGAQLAALSAAVGDYYVYSDNRHVVLTAGTAANTIDATVTPTATETLVATGNVTITSKKVVADTGSAVKLSTNSDDKVTTKTKIDKKVIAPATYASIDKDGKTYLYKTDVSDSDRIDVTDSEVVFGGDDGIAATATDVTVSDGTVSKVSGTVTSLEINGGTVSAVDLDDGTVAVDDAKVGNVTTDDGNGTGTGSVTVSSGKVGNIKTSDAAAGDVTVTGGTVGTIDVADGATVSLDTMDGDTPVVTDAITAKTVKIDSDDGKLTTGKITSDAAAGTIDLTGDNVAVSGINFDYYTTTLTLADFNGTIPAATNGLNGTISCTNSDDTDATYATVTGAAKFDTISVDDLTSLAFTDAIQVGDVSGSGTLKIFAGKLYVTGSASSTVLRLADTTLAAGTTVFTADTDTVDASDFTTFGFTVAKTAGAAKDTFKIDSLNFAGLAIDKPTTRVAVGASQTYTTTAYPGGTSAPAGSQIVWDFSGNNDVFDVTTSGNTATVTVKSVDTTFSSENVGTLTATLYDADGYELDDYAPATATVTAIAVPEATSDTHSDLSVGKGASYTFKITSATAPSFTTGTAGVFGVALASHTGNDYFYKITATGNVGASTGIYLNGTKLLVASVKSAFTVDTTKDTTVKGSYTLKVTSATTPTFGVGTAGVFKAEFVSKTGNDYFYKLTSVGAVGTKAGIFVDGTKVFVATVG